MKSTLYHASPGAFARPYVGAAILFFLPLLIFSPLLFGGRFFWDDYILLVDNPLIKSHAGLFSIWFSMRNPDYFPLTSTLFWVEWRLWGMHAQGYHVVNVLLHIGSSFLLWRIFRRLRVPGAFLIALLFAIHPVNVESAAWIAEGKNTLSMFFMCAALLLYLRFERRGRLPFYLAALACFLLALLAKTAVVMFPFVLLVLAWRRRRRIVLSDLLRAVPFFVLSLLLGLVTLYFQYHNAIADVVVRNDSFASRLATAGCAVWFYLGKALFPIGILFNYPRWNVLSHGLIAFLPLVLLIAAFVTLWCLRRTRARQGLAALGVYVLMLFPVLGFLNIFFMRYSLVSDHWQYQAIPAILALAVGTLAFFTRRWPFGIKLIAALLLLSIFAVDSFSIAAVYRTPQSIWQDTLAHNPAAWLADAQLGEMYLGEAASDPARLAPAIEHLAKVVQLQSQRAVGYVNLANAYVRDGKPAVAAQLYTEGLSAPDATAIDRARLYQGLGSLEAKAGRYARAETLFRQALQLDSESFSINLYLALTLFHENKREEARAAVEQAIVIDPGNPTAEALLQSLLAPATSARSLR